jgi:signal peptidase I
MSDFPGEHSSHASGPGEGSPPPDPGPPRFLSDEIEAHEGKRGADVVRFFKELPVLIAVALVIALLLKAFVAQAFYIEQQSMEPTLHPGERVLVSKFSYRFGQPKRGDIVIFSDPRHPCELNKTLPECHPSVARRVLDWFAEVFGLPTGSKEDLVKRIVGLPNETIAVNHGKLYVCERPGCRPLSDDGVPIDGHVVNFPHNSTTGPQPDRSDVNAYRIPAGEYYVMGDNREASADSRAFGSVPRKEFVGRVFVLIWPPTRFRGL